MKVNELMIGDWVMTPYGPHKVDTIYGDTGRVSADLIELDISELDAIPLTPEILEKNGFRKTDGGQWVIEKRRSIGGYRGQTCQSPIYYAAWVDSRGMGLVSDLEIEGNMYISGRYVHQLQNMLHSYGLDEYIKIEL